jgi:8-oxo-dGTP pyrophosphatase MutT (NUDIX family)
MKKIYFNDRFIGVAGLDHAVSSDGGMEQILVTDCKDIPNLVKYFDDTPSIAGLILKGADRKAVFRAVRACFTGIEAAGGLVVNPRGEVLMIYRYDRWDLPKGKVERGEEVEDAAVREVEEECGVTDLAVELKLCKTYHVYTMRGKRMFKTTHWYLMRHDGSGALTPQTEEAITDARWVAPADLAACLENTYQTILEVFRGAEKDGNAPDAGR